MRFPSRASHETHKTASISYSRLPKSYIRHYRKLKGRGKILLDNSNTIDIYFFLLIFHFSFIF